MAMWTTSSGEANAYVDYTLNMPEAVYNPSFNYSARIHGLAQGGIGGYGYVRTYMKLLSSGGSELDSEEELWVEQGAFTAWEDDDYVMLNMTYSGTLSADTDYRIRLGFRITCGNGGNVQLDWYNNGVTDLEGNAEILWLDMSQEEFTEATLPTGSTGSVRSYQYDYMTKYHTDTQGNADYDFDFFMKTQRSINSGSEGAIKFTGRFLYDDDFDSSLSPTRARIQWYILNSAGDTIVKEGPVLA
jgi:hypothetical protein